MYKRQTLLCDVSTGVPRPLVPSQHRREVFNAVHGLAHLGPVPTTRAVSDRFVWHNLRRDVRTWCRECADCQASKVGRHVKSPFEKFAAPERRFGHLHVDLVGPLPESEGRSYIFTMVDRWSRWPEAIPVKDISAATCADALIRGWIARFGVPSNLTSDRGAQFTSALWAELGRTLAIKNINTTAYHPQANGLVERFHRTLKAALMATGEPTSWMGRLPHVLLGIRTAQKEDTGFSPAEIVYLSLIHI